MAEPLNSTNSSEDEMEDDKYLEKIQDLANDKVKELVKEREVVLADIVLLNDFLLYKDGEGVFPFESSDRMKKYCNPWIRAGYGNMAGWNAKIEHLKNKYKNHVGPIEPGEQEEFESWKMVFGNEGSSSGGNDDDQKPVA